MNAITRHGMTTLDAMLADAAQVRKRHRKEYGQQISRSKTTPEQARVTGSIGGKKNCYRGGRSNYSPVRDKVQKCLTDEWQTTNQIAEAIGMTRDRTKACLRDLKGYGLAEHQIPGKLAMWRRASEQPK